MINQHGFEIGVLGGEHPYVRVGKRRPPILVLPGLTLDYRPPSWWVMSSRALDFRRLSTARTVYVVQRRRGLPSGTTLRDLADQYAALIRQEWGQADLLGLSCGGAIAQHIGLDHPESVGSLILVMSGARLGAAGRDIGLRWLGLAQTGEWALLREELLHSGLGGDPSNRQPSSFRRAPIEGWPPDPADAQDFVTVLSSLLTQDTSLRLPDLSLPTLVTGSGQDPFYPEAALRDLAAAIPRSTFIYRQGSAGSGRQPAPELQDDVLDFLLGRLGAAEPPPYEKGNVSWS